MEQNNIYKSGEYSRFFTPESETFPFSRVYEEKRKIILERLAAGGKTILDLGGGRGRLSIPLSLKNRVFMADLSMQMIEEARAAKDGASDEIGFDQRVRDVESNALPGNAPYLAGSIDFICCDAECPPFKKESFDVLLAIDLLPHVKSAGKCIKGIYDLLKPGGTAIIDNSNSMPLWMFAFPEYVNWKTHPVKFIRTFLHGGILPNWAHAITHMNKEEFLEHVRIAGLVIIDFIELGPSYCPKWHLAFCRKPRL